MKLWEKNYLLTFILFIIVLNGGLFLLTAASFERDFTRELETAAREEQSIKYSIASIYPVKIKELCARYALDGIFMEVSDETGLLAETLSAIFSNQKESDSIDGAADPSKLEIERVAGSSPGGRGEIVRIKGIKYLSITDEITVTDLTQDAGTTHEKKLNLVYMREIEAVYGQQKARLVLSATVSLLLSMLVGIMLYLTMKKIYRPVSNIAHELRTPLTEIQGYAQYLMAGKLSEQDRLFAEQRILTGARELKDIADRLLIMGSLRKGSVRFGRISMEKLLLEIQSQYAGAVAVENHIKTLYGDETLIKCMICNLVNNGLRAGNRVLIEAKEGDVSDRQGVGKRCEITIVDNGPGMSDESVRRLNKNKPLPDAEVKGSGHGIGLCHEIAKLHGGSIRFESIEKTGQVTLAPDGDETAAFNHTEEFTHGTVVRIRL